ncbi:hypothetical protein [Silvimonas amylolytica]|uniref:Uncharacterized protein n=1 Tax=Silvimonas amylolytica TaxID=449663 RepID=A0ABQ2PN57_9NEIS|nr:hypothetical protein [Silvimonas amylolytica]GGP27034.1 hypothetical protein GCM10010971_28530 [Silvimonas amylolytica]
MKKILIAGLLLALQSTHCATALAAEIAVHPYNQDHARAQPPAHTAAKEPGRRTAPGDVPAREAKKKGQQTGNRKGKRCQNSSFCWR